MAGFFSVKLAPGVRVSASSRGLRAHVGPRGARVHVGGGRTGVSTGAGPFTFYESLGAGRSSRPYRTGPSASQIAGAQKAGQAQLIVTALRAIDDIHRQSFPAATKPAAALPPVPPFPVLLATAVKDQRAGIGFFKFKARAAAKARARQIAEARAQQLLADAQEKQRAAQQELDTRWAELLANKPDQVLAELAAAFEDNEAPVAPVGVEDAEVSLVVLVPAADAVPDRYPTTTDGGNLSIRKATKTMRADWYRQLVAGHVVVSAKEAFAVAPGLEVAGIVALRDQGQDVYGARRAEPVLCTRLSRTGLAAVRWEQAGAWDVVEQTGTETLVSLKGSTRELTPLDLAGEPDLARVVASVDLDELEPVEHP